jgi:hypothetical protein
MLRRVTSFSHAVATEPRGATPFLAGALIRPAAATEKREVGRLITEGPKAKGGDIGAEKPDLPTLAEVRPVSRSGFAPLQFACRFHPSLGRQGHTVLLRNTR